MSESFVLDEPQWVVAQEGADGPRYVVLPPGVPLEATPTEMSGERWVELAVRTYGFITAVPESAGTWSAVAPVVPELDLLTQDEVAERVESLRVQVPGAATDDEQVDGRVLRTDEEIAIALSDGWLVLPPGSRLQVTEARAIKGSARIGDDPELTFSGTIVGVAGVAPDGTDFVAEGGLFGELVDGEPNLAGARQLSTDQLVQEYGLGAIEDEFEDEDEGRMLSLAFARSEARSLETADRARALHLSGTAYAYRPDDVVETEAILDLVERDARTAGWLAVPHDLYHQNDLWAFYRRHDLIARWEALEALQPGERRGTHAEHKRDEGRRARAVVDAALSNPGMGPNALASAVGQEPRYVSRLRMSGVLVPDEAGGRGALRVADYIASALQGRAR